MNHFPTNNNNNTSYSGGRNLVFVVILLATLPSLAISYHGPLYDHTAYSECKPEPEEPLYNGGILGDTHPPEIQHKITADSMINNVYSPSLILHNLAQGTIYCFSTWVKVGGPNSTLITASLKTDDTDYGGVGTVVAQSGCWSFLKGGFVLDSSSNLSILFFQSSDNSSVNIEISNASLQPFSEEEWRENQNLVIHKERKRAVIVHVADANGNRLEGANVTVSQIYKDFPIGSAIASTILGNTLYQDWFVERFNAAVFENELKWYATEPEQGKENYTVADEMLKFVRANQIVARGHNIFWEDPDYNPAWVRNLTSQELRSAVDSRIRSLMNKYREEFVHWDVSNEMLHYDFYEERLGPNATLHFYRTAHRADPLANLFMNEFNVVENCDSNSTADAYISKIRELERGGATMDGIGLESHFSKPNPPFIRGVLDKLATLGLPIWLTEVDISDKFDQHTQSVYLEQVLREGFSHPSVDGIMLWTALHPKGCYRMCLTDNNFNNLPAGEVVDMLLKQWETARIVGQTDNYGSYPFRGFLGEYQISVSYGQITTNSTMSLGRGCETQHFTIHL